MRRHAPYQAMLRAASKLAGREITDLVRAKTLIQRRLAAAEEPWIKHERLAEELGVGSGAVKNWRKQWRVEREAQVTMPRAGA